MVDMSLSQNNDILVLLSAKFKSWILLQEISDATKIGIYYAVTIKVSKENNSLVQFPIFLLMKIKEVLYPPFQMKP